MDKTMDEASQQAPSAADGTPPVVSDSPLPPLPLMPLPLPDLRTVLHALVRDLGDSATRPAVDEIVARLLAIDGELIKYEQLLAAPLGETVTVGKVLSSAYEEEPPCPPIQR